MGSKRMRHYWSEINFGEAAGFAIPDAIRVTIDGTAHYRLLGEDFTICAELVPEDWDGDVEHKLPANRPICRCCFFNFKSAMGPEFTRWAFNPGGPCELELSWHPSWDAAYRKLLRWSRLRVE